MDVSNITSLTGSEEGERHERTQEGQSASLSFGFS